MTQRDFDIWLHGFSREAREAPPIAISRVFRIPVQAAEALVATLPRVVKRDASADQAERLVHALEAIGGVAEAIPTRIMVAPVVVVGSLPQHAKPETIVRHAPRAGVPREQPLLDGVASSGETLKIGTHELAAYHASALASAQLATEAPDSAPPLMSPDITLVDREPPHWDAAELARVHPPAAPQPTVQQAAVPAPLVFGSLIREPTAIEHATPLESRGRWDDLELTPPEDTPPISLAPPEMPASPVSPSAEPSTSSSMKIVRNDHAWLDKVAQGSVPLTPLSSHPPPASDTSWLTLTPHPVGQLGSERPNAWTNPMALPPRDAQLRSVGMRTAGERMRALKQPRSMHPPSIRPRVTEEEPGAVEAFMMLARGDFRGATKASPTVTFSVILLGVTLAFALAYAAS